MILAPWSAPGSAPEILVGTVLDSSFARWGKPGGGWQIAADPPWKPGAAAGLRLAAGAGKAPACGAPGQVNLAPLSAPGSGPGILVGTVLGGSAARWEKPGGGLQIVGDAPLKPVAGARNCLAASAGKVPAGLVNLAPW